MRWWRPPNRSTCTSACRPPRPRPWTRRCARGWPICVTGRGAALPQILDHDRRRAEIALVACRVVARYGFDQATIVRIAREAGYTTGMVAHYFDTKRDIVIAALRLILRRVEERLTRAGTAAAADLLELLTE